MQLITHKLQVYRENPILSESSETRPSNSSTGEALRSQAFAISLDKPPDLVVDSIWNWIDSVKPVVESESHFLDNRQDLISLSKEHSKKELLDHVLEKHFYRLFVTKVGTLKNVGPQVQGILTEDARPLAPGRGQIIPSNTTLPSRSNKLLD